MPNKLVLGPEANETLQHFGILGMKWGQRRYQNADGSLTSAGEKRYNSRNAEVLNGKDMSPERALSAVGPEGKQIISQRETAIKKQLNEEDWLDVSERIGSYAYEDAIKIFKQQNLDKRVGAALEVALNDRYVEVLGNTMDEKYPDGVWHDGVLRHHGILGQKWGIRRFQRPDGTRTPAGRRRVEAQENESDDSRAARQNRSRSPSELSNDELRRLNERLQLESTYRNLTSPAQVKKGESWVQKALLAGAAGALTTITKEVALASAKKLVKSFVELDAQDKKEKK